MKYFKTQATRTAPRYEITPKIFDKVTEHKYPFEQININNTLSQYGICPSCLNPIQLIGIAREIKITPYGKHAGKNVPGLPQWNRFKYEYCPFAVKNDRREMDDEERLPEITKDVVELYDLLKNQFDRVVYIISQELDIRCSTKFWENALQQYLANRVYCYPWLTEANLPYIFAYRGITHRNVYGQQIRVGSDLFNALKMHKNVNFKDPKNENSENKDVKYKILTGKNEYLNLEFRFTGHTQKAVSGETLKESMTFCIDDLISGDTVFQRCVQFSENYFMNIVNNVENENRRQQWLLNIANKYMQPLNMENSAC